MVNDEDEYHIEYWTHEQAVATARQQATRDLRESESIISYVAFVPSLGDFCRCEFRLEAPHGWVQSCRILTQEERGADEQITDAHIREVALSGNVITAIRLYRGKYNVGLLEAKTSVEQMISKG